jgi:polysaccharide pyruvyl transferase WcaK-like protein
VRIHLGHHFYGAGNLGDDFMLAGFLAALRRHAGGAALTACVPFDREPLQRRFPAVTWLPCDEASRDRAIAGCEVWLGLGGSPLQHAQSRWFLDHLLGETHRCTAARKPMFFLGVGVQSAGELADA